MQVNFLKNIMLKLIFIFKQQFLILIITPLSQWRTDWFLSFKLVIGVWLLVIDITVLTKKYWDIGWIFIIIKNPILIYIHHLLFLSFRKIIEGKGSRWVILKTFCTQNWTKKNILLHVFCVNGNSIKGCR